MFKGKEEDPVKGIGNGPGWTGEWEKQLQEIGRVGE